MPSIWIRRNIMAVSQAKNILAHLLQHRTITPLEALNQYGCFRLAAVILNLKKDGHKIETQIIKKNKKRFAQYHYASETKTN